MVALVVTFVAICVKPALNVRASNSMYAWPLKVAIVMVPLACAVVNTVAPGTVEVNVKTAAFGVAVIPGTP